MKKYLLLTILFTTLFSHSASAISPEFLEEKYLPKFEDIERRAILQLNSLIDEAYVEYHNKKEKGEITLPLLFNYIERGKKLEDDVEIEFQSLLTQVKAEIKANDLPEELTYPYEKYYIKSKRNNKLKILKNITLEGHKITF
ncbi:hypothetical protein BKP37_13085 [Anaerobacillus alkalilacustris]|uniref:Uncharacterized protein n=1 Tax=Anaerobacillus alkalilacustris TaxID=393763 RepID=A0A1S2LIY3_9BACI|nr:hypothetical protein [Anaerobacillus alkalilacustris]OIJ12371.1 hypothetical protein BKP37_13085 [Anaerobacillus alkalilacustris]